MEARQREDSIPSAVAALIEDGYERITQEALGEKRVELRDKAGALAPYSCLYAVVWQDEEGKIWSEIY